MDVELKTAAGSVKAHKVVLAAGSEYFKTLFTGPFKEQSECVIDLSCTFDNVHGLREIINYLYGDDINIEEEKLSSVLHAASILLIPEVTIVCGHYMLNNITLENCLTFWLLSDTYSLVELAESFSRFAKIRFSDAYMKWSDTLSIPFRTMEKLFKCDFAKLAKADDLCWFLDKYFSHNKSSVEEKETLLHVSGLKEKRKSENHENSDTVIGINTSEALLVNIDGGESHLIYVSSCDSWFKFPNNYIQGKKNIYEMCLGPERNFCLIRDDISGPHVKLIETSSGNICDLQENFPSRVEKELLAENNQVTRTNDYFFALNHELFCVVESHITLDLPNSEDTIEFVEIYIFVYEFEKFSWKFMENIFSTESVMEKYYCNIKTENNVAYICVQNDNEINLCRLKTIENKHTVEKLASHKSNLTYFGDFPEIYFLIHPTTDTVGFGIKCNNKELHICYYEKYSNTWKDINADNDWLELIEDDSERYDCTSLHFMESSQESPNLQYYEGHYEGYCSRFFIGQIGAKLKELAPIPLVSCETVEESPMCTFSISSDLLHILEPASCLDQLDKLLLEGCWSAYEIKEELQNRFTEI